MLRFLLGRLGLLIPTFIGVTFVAFTFIRLLPGDPAELLAGERGITPERKAEVMKQLGFDKPYWQQYLDYILGIFQGDLGTSFSSKKPVLDEFMTLFPATAEPKLTVGRRVRIVQKRNWQLQPRGNAFANRIVPPRWQLRRGDQIPAGKIHRSGCPEPDLFDLTRRSQTLVHLVGNVSNAVHRRVGTFALTSRNLFVGKCLPDIIHQADFDAGSPNVDAPIKRGLGLIGWSDLAWVSHGRG